MRKILTFLGIAGSQAANIATLLGVPGAVVLSAVLGIFVAWSDKLNTLVHTSGAETGAAVFLFSLWTYIGLYTLAMKRYPVIIKRLVDIGYGLSITNTFFIFDSNNLLALQFAVNLQNYSGQALRYRFNKFDVTLVSRRASLDTAAPTDNIITFGGARAFRSQSYPLTEIESFFGKEIEGKIEIELDYGLINGAPTRRLVEELKIVMNFKDINLVRWNETILVYKENDI